MTTFRRRLIQAMADKNLNVTELAEITGTQYTTIYKYLRSDAAPSAFTLGCLADALGVSMDWLWGRE